MKNAAHLRRRRRWIAGVVTLLLVTAVFFAAGGCCIPSSPFESALVLGDIAAGDKSSRLKERTDEPKRVQLEYEVAGRDYQADLYLPANEIACGLVLIPGAAEEGKNDARVVALAKTLARARFAVLTPDLVAIREFNLGPDNIRDVADAVSYLASREDLAPGGTVGLFAASYAVGPCVVAALKTPARYQVRFIIGVGGYYDIVNALAFLTTGYYRDGTDPEASWQYLEPSSYGKWAFVLSYADRFPSDSDLLRRIAERKMDNAQAPVPELVDQLSAEGAIFYELLVNEDPERVPKLIGELPQAIQQELESLDLSEHNLAALAATLILVHGRNDTMIPYTESLALAEAAPEDQVHLYLMDHLAHVTVEEFGFWDAVRLWRAVGTILEQRHAESR